MAISLTALNNFKDTDLLVFDKRSGTVKAAGFWQKVKTFFNIFGARRQNRETLAEIKSAILADFTSTDLKALATEKIDQVRGDRVIGAAEIKGILQELRQTSVNYKERVLMQWAAHDEYPELAHAGPEVIKFVADRLVRDPRIHGAPAAADVPKFTREMLQEINDLVGKLRRPGTQDRIDPQLVKVVAGNLDEVAWEPGRYKGDRVPRSDADVTNRMESIRLYWDAAQARARQEEDPRGFMFAAESLLDTLLKDPELKSFGHFDDLIREVPLQDLKNRDADAIFERLQVLQVPPPPPAPPAPPAPELPSLPVIRKKHDLTELFFSLEPGSQVGGVVKDGAAADADGASRYHGLVFWTDSRNPYNVSLFADQPAPNGISASKSLDGALQHAKEGEWLYVVNTARFPSQVKARAEESGDEVNCPRIPFAAIVGWIEISDAVANASDKEDKLRYFQRAGLESCEINARYLD